MDEATRDPARPILSDLSGTTLGKYRLVEKLGQGGMAQVYKAYQPDLDRYVAIKILHPHLTGDAEFAARFQREARAIAALEHPNIVFNAKRVPLPRSNTPTSSASTISTPTGWRFS